MKCNLWKILLNSECILKILNTLELCSRELRNNPLTESIWIYISTPALFLQILKLHGPSTNILDVHSQRLRDNLVHTTQFHVYTLGTITFLLNFLIPWSNSKHPLLSPYRAHIVANTVCKDIHSKNLPINHFLMENWLAMPAQLFSHTSLNSTNTLYLSNILSNPSLHNAFHVPDLFSRTNTFTSISQVYDQVMSASPQIPYFPTNRTPSYYHYFSCNYPIDYRWNNKLIYS